MSHVIATVLRHEFRNLRSNRGVLFAGLAMLVITESVLRLTGTAPRALVTMLNLVLLLVPLVAILFGVISGMPRESLTNCCWRSLCVGAPSSQACTSAWSHPSPPPSRLASCCRFCCTAR